MVDPAAARPGIPSLSVTEDDFTNRDSATDSAVGLEGVVRLPDLREQALGSCVPVHEGEEVEG